MANAEKYSLLVGDISRTRARIPFAGQLSTKQRKHKPRVRFVEEIFPIAVPQR